MIRFEKYDGSQAKNYQEDTQPDKINATKKSLENFHYSTAFSTRTPASLT